MNDKNLKIESEIGKLKKVLIHRPGKELERIVPDSLKELLFEDIPWLKRMQEEHDSFADILRMRGAEVFYVEDLLKDILKNTAIRENLIAEVIDKNPSSGNYIDGFLNEYLMSLDSDALGDALIAGVLQKELDHLERHRVLTDYLKGPEPYAFYLNPLPNLYFMRDPAVTIHDGMSISAMATRTRKRESRYMSAIYEHHPMFASCTNKTFYQDTNFFSVEGGDVLILSPTVVAVGCSERTEVQGVEELAKNLFNADLGIEKVLAVKIPSNRAFMHLDTVFTMVDYDKFIVYPGILEQVETVIMTPGKKDYLHYERKDSLTDALKSVLNLPAINLIQSGGGNPVAAAREQWNDSTNTLAIAPGVIVAYARNERSNEVLQENGIEVIGIEASELVRGRGGPRCMTMPLYRDSF
ncbi:MAG: arginine deiminase [Acetobacterium sp.]|nr:arginine deiminase [Bacillota bacterium]MCG2729301.1 arginine deiminase [Acetobacterium sp.]